MTMPRQLLRPPEWTLHALCDGHRNIGWWHSDNDLDRYRARRICAECPVRLQCAKAALARGEHHGVWGGLDLTDRRQVAADFGYPRPGQAEHGTRSRYVAGCRCEDCRRAHRIYEHDRRLRVAARRPPALILTERHGRGRHTAWPGQYVLPLDWPEPARVGAMQAA